MATSLRRVCSALSQPTFSDQAYYPGQRVLLCLPAGEDTGRRTMHATVRRCQPHREGYRLGLEFDSGSLHSWYEPAEEAMMAA